MKIRHILLSILIVSGCIFFSACQGDTPDMGAIDSPVLMLTEDTVTMHVGETHKLSLTYSISGLEWSSQYDTIATVDFRGVVTAIQAGTTTVTAKRTYEKENLPERSASCFIRVTE